MNAAIADLQNLSSGDYDGNRQSQNHSAVGADEPRPPEHRVVHVASRTAGITLCLPVQGCLCRAETARKSLSTRHPDETHDFQRLSCKL